VQGALRIIAGMNREHADFQAQCYLVSNRAYDAGLKSIDGFAGHSFAITQFGSTTHYALSLLATKQGFDLKAMRLVPLQTIPNMISAMAGNQVDIVIVTGASGLPAVAAGKGHLLGWVGDETPWQIGAVFTATRNADERQPVLARFLAAFRKGAAAYHDAFTDDRDQRRDGPTAAEITAIVAKYTEQPEALIKGAITFVDRDGRLDVKDVLRQIEWYRSQGMVRSDGDAGAVIDRRYVLPMAE